MTAQLELLRAQGIKVALDDFGTGYSSFQHLHEIPTDILKIDRAFVKRLGTDAGATAIVRASIDLGAAFEMVTVAEGVESESHRRLLQSLGCQRIQGFLIAPALPPKAATAMMADRLPQVGPASPDALVSADRAACAPSAPDEHCRPSHRPRSEPARRLRGRS